MRKKILSLILSCSFILSLLQIKTLYAKQADSEFATAVAQIRSAYEGMEDFAATVVQDNIISGRQVKVSGRTYYKKPYKFRAEVQVSGMGQDGVKNLAVFDGELFWQQQSSLDDKILNVMKSEIDKYSLQGKEILEQFSPKDYFESIMNRYNIESLNQAEEGGTSLYILDMRLKKEISDNMEQMAKISKANTSRQMIPYQMLFYWDKENGYCRKMEVFNGEKALISSVEYRDAKVNSNLKDNLFSYQVPKGANVMDMTAIMNRERKKQESEGIEHDRVGSKCPQFSLVDLDGKIYDAEQLKGKIVIINFWATWCEFCLKELPLIENIFLNFQKDNDVQILTITQGKKDKIMDFVEEHGFVFPVLVDGQGEISYRFGVDSVPRVFVINKYGRIAAVYLGYHADIEEVLIQDIERLR